MKREGAAKKKKPSRATERGAKVLEGESQRTEEKVEETLEKEKKNRRLTFFRVVVVVAPPSSFYFSLFSPPPRTVHPTLPKAR